MSNTPTYPEPFFIRLCAPSPRAGNIRAIILFVVLFIIGVSVDALLSISGQFPFAILFLGVYCGLVSFGIWALGYVYWQTKHTLEGIELVGQTKECLREIYARKPMLTCAVTFAVFVGLVQIAIQFKVSFWISMYFCLTNVVAGFVAGLGFWTACGSLRLGDAISKSTLPVFLVAPFQTPNVRKLSRLMWNYSLFFTFEVLLFSIVVTLAAMSMSARATPILGNKFTAFDVAGASSFFFLALFSPIYTLALQQRIQFAVRYGKEAALAQLDTKLRAALETSKSSDHESLSDLLSATQAVRDARELPLSADKVTKLLSILLPGLAYIYSQNSDLINELGGMIVKAFLPGIGK